MKKIWVIVNVCLILILSACGSKEIVKDKSQKDEEEKEQLDLKQIYLDIVDSKKEYVDKDNNKQYALDYYKSLQYGPVNLAYKLIDLDGDKTEEMVVAIDSTDRFYLVLHYEEGVVYGFYNVARGMAALREDGTYVASGGADYNYYLKAKFNKNKMEEIILAKREEDKCYIDEKETTEEEYQEYVEQFEKKEMVNFTQYKVLNVGDDIVGQKKLFTTGSKSLEYGTYYLELEDGSLATDNSGIITINEDGTCFMAEGWSNMGCQSFYAKDNGICFKTSEMAQDKCFTIDNNKMLDDYTVYRQK